MRRLLRAVFAIIAMSFDFEDDYELRLSSEFENSDDSENEGLNETQSNVSSDDNESYIAEEEESSDGFE